MPRTRFLVAGWFSFEDVVATVGDLLARDVAAGWLHEAGVAHDVAGAPFLPADAPDAPDACDWRTVEPARYTDVLFVCGPFGQRRLIGSLLERFAHCRLWGLGVSLLDTADRERFTVLLERDADDAPRARPDLSFAAPAPRVPVAGVALAPAQHEYGASRHEEAAGALHRLARNGGLALVDVDTDLLAGAQEGLRRAEELESLIARTDVVLTSRLHGLVLALRAGVPAVVVDPVPGGAKVRRQAEAVGWPAVLTVDEADEERLAEALRWCLTGEARARARACVERARGELAGVRGRLFAALGEAQPSASWPSRPT